MTNTVKEFNDCALLYNNKDFKEGLEIYDKIKADGKYPIIEMRNIQKKLQEILHEKLPDQTYDINDIVDTRSFKTDQIQAIIDEFSELIDSLPGSDIDVKTRTALWKRWKSKYNEIRSIKFSSLSDKDKYNTYYEVIDILHFVLNYTLIFDFPDDKGKEFEKMLEEISIENKENIELLLIDSDIGNLYDFIESIRNLMLNIYLNNATLDDIDLDDTNFIELFPLVLIFIIGKAFNLTEREMFALYYSKNKENINRYNNNY